MLIKGKEINLDEVVGSSENAILAAMEIGKMTGLSFGKAKKIVAGCETRPLDERFRKTLQVLTGYNDRLRPQMEVLRKNLLKDEKIRALASARKENWDLLLVCTNKRVLVISSNDVKEVRLNNVGPVTCSIGTSRGDIYIGVGTDTWKYTDVPNATLKRFIDVVHRSVETLRAETAPAPKAAQQSVGVADEILKLKQLLDAGIITQEEFEHQKKKLLGM